MFNVVLASDEGFVPYLSICMISLLKNNDFDLINIFILDNGISKESKDKLNCMITEFNAKLTFIDAVKIDELVEDIPVMEKCGLTSLAPYSRLFLPSLLPKDIDKVLYLDVDSLVVGSFKELWGIDLGNHPCGAVLDLNNCLDIFKTNIDLNLEDNYFNSGVLLINLNYWRNNNLESKFLEFLINYRDVLNYWDQDVINGVLSENIKVIHPKYNLLMLFHEIKAKAVIKWEGIHNFYDLETIKSAQKNPVFLHFAGGPICRPWFNKNLKYFKLFDDYAKLTPFYNNVYDEAEIPKVLLFKDKLYKSYIFYIFISLIPMNTCVNWASKRKNKLYIKK